jgi:hypothetical protein
MIKPKRSEIELPRLEAVFQTSKIEAATRLPVPLLQGSARGVPGHGYAVEPAARDAAPTRTIAVIRLKASANCTFEEPPTCTR